MTVASDKKIIAGFGLAVILIFVVGIIVFQNARQFIDSNQQLTHTLEVLNELDTTLTLILDAETGQRGFVITSDESYLEPYEDAIQNLPEHLTQLEALIADNPRQQARLAALLPLIDERLDIINRTILLVRDEDSDSARQTVLTGAGKAVMDAIRVHIAEMRGEELRLLTEQRQTAQATTEAALFSAGFIAISVIGLIAVNYWLISKSIRYLRRAQAALQVSREKWRSLVENAPNVISTLDRLGNIEFINHLPPELKLEDVVGRSFEQLIPAEESANFRAVMQQVETSGRPAQLELRSWTGRYHAVTVAPIAIDDQVTGFISSSTDITDRKLTEDKIKRLADEFQDLYDNAPCGYHSLDADGTYTQINDTELRWLGYSREEVVDKLKFSDVITAESLQTFRQNFPLFKARGWINDLEFEMVRRDGTTFTVVLSATAIKDAEGNYVSSRSTLFDITDRKHREQEIARLNETLQQRTAEVEAINKELESFSYSVSHDLRAPLRAIDGFSQALLEDYADKLDKEGQSYLQRVRAAANRMAELIDDLINLSRITRADMRRAPVDLSAVARNIAHGLRERHPDRQVDVVVEDGLMTEGDERLLRVALENLIGNAWKFTSRHYQARIEIGLLEDAQNGPAFFVRDDGEGFDMAYADKLFGAFQRLHGMNEFEGTGIGLATVQRVIHRHGGRIWAEGERGKGATFFFAL